MIRNGGDGGSRSKSGDLNIDMGWCGEDESVCNKSIKNANADEAAWSRLPSRGMERVVTERVGD